MSSPGPQRSSRFKDGSMKLFHSNPSSRSSSPRPRPTKPPSVLDPFLNQEDSSSESATQTLKISNTRLPPTKTQSIPPEFHAHAAGSSVVHTATELALTSSNLLAAPFTQEPGIAAGLLHASVSSLPPPSTVITSVPIDTAATSESGNTALPVSIQSTLPQDITAGDSHSHSRSVDEALEANTLNTIASTSQTTEAQGIIPPPVIPSEETATAASNDSLEKDIPERSSNGNRTPSGEADNENVESSEAISDEREAFRCSNLAYSCYDTFVRSEDLVDIGEAISMLQRAVQLTADGDPRLPKWLGDLGIFYRERFNGAGDLADIEAAISAQQKAIRLTPKGHAHLPSQLTNLGSSFRCRFGHTGDLADIEAAISAQQRAVELAPQGHAYLPGWLNNLGNSFQTRFGRTGDLADIEAAIAAQCRAVELTPQGHADLPGWLNNLGNSFQSRFRRTGDLADIAEAVSAQQRAVALTPEGHAYLPGWLNSLGNSLQFRFGRTGHLADIAEAISAQQRAVELTPKGHADLPSRLSNLGNSFRSRFDRTGDLADIEAATAAQRRAVELTPQVLLLSLDGLVRA